MATSETKEEDCYQNKRREKKGSSFFKIIQLSCLQHGRLAIPKKFTRDFGKKLSPTVVLQVPNKKEWHVELREDDGQVWFQNGWKEFMEYHSICVGHFLIFNYDGYSRFNVVLFDMTTCEIEYPCDTDDDSGEPSNENESQSSGFQKQGKRISSRLARNKRKQEEDTGNKRNLLVGNKESRIQQEENGKVGQKSSNFRGVTRRKSTGKFEVCVSFERKRVYLGAYETEEKAAQVYDLAAFKYRRPTAIRKLNFPTSNYEKQLEEMNIMSREEYANGENKIQLEDNGKVGRRSSRFLGVSRRKSTGKFEASLCVNSKGEQVYLGAYETEEKGAQIYDLAALKCWGPNATTELNFPTSNYEKQLEEMNTMSTEEYVNSLRRNNIYFARGCSNYRGVTKRKDGHHWEAQISRLDAGGTRKMISLGKYDTEEEAARSYDISAVKLHGMNAFTNFDIRNYYKEGTKEFDVW